MQLKTINKLRINVKYASVNYDAVTDPYLTPSDKDTLVVLALLAQHKRMCWPSLRSISLILDLNPATNQRNTRRRLAKLEQMGYITRVPRYANENGEGRQRSNMFYLNYDCSLTKVEPQHMHSYNPWDLVTLRQNFSTESENTFTPPIYRSNIERKEKIFKKEKKVPLPSLSLAQAFAPAGTNLFTYRKVYSWFKRPVRYLTTKKNGFLHVRSKYGERRHMQKKDLPAKETIPTGGEMTNEEFERLFVEDLRPKPVNENKNWRPEDHPKVCEILSTFPDSKIVGVELPTKTVDKPVDNMRNTGIHIPNNGNKKISWIDLTVQISKLNSTFTDWMHALRYSQIYNGKMILLANSQFMRDTIENRFKHDILKACSILKIDAKYVEIEVNK